MAAPLCRDPLTNPQGRSTAQVPSPRTAAELATSAEWLVCEKRGRQVDQELSTGEGRIWLISMGRDVNLSL